MYRGLTVTTTVELLSQHNYTPKPHYLGHYESGRTTCQGRPRITFPFLLRNDSNQGNGSQVKYKKPVGHFTRIQQKRGIERDLEDYRHSYSNSTLNVFREHFSQYRPLYRSLTLNRSERLMLYKRKTKSKMSHSAQEQTKYSTHRPNSNKLV